MVRSLTHSLTLSPSVTHAAEERERKFAAGKPHVLRRECESLSLSLSLRVSERTKTDTILSQTERTSLTSGFAGTRQRESGAAQRKGGERRQSSSSSSSSRRRRVARMLTQTEEPRGSGGRDTIVGKVGKTPDDPFSPSLSLPLFPRLLLLRLGSRAQEQRLRHEGSRG